jgi:hypothetical protein
MLHPQFSQHNLFLSTQATATNETIQNSLSSNLFPGAMVINLFVQVSV